MGKQDSLGQHWGDKVEQPEFIPSIEVWAKNLRAKPYGNGKLKIQLADDSRHAAVWNTLERHAKDSEVVLSLGKDQKYTYYCVSEEDGFFLHPSDEQVADDLPDDRVFIKQAFHLRMSY